MEIVRRSPWLLAMAALAVACSSGGGSGSSGGGLIAVCGDGVVGSGEACDDGNTVAETACANGVPSCTGCSPDCARVLTLTGAVLQLGSGDGQTGAAGELLPAPLVVKVTRGGTPVPGITVAWNVVAGGGSVSAAASTTDAEGLASGGWTLGTVAGAPQVVTATAAGFAGVPVAFTAAVVPGEPVQLAIRQQPTDTMSGAVIAPSVQVALEDRFGNLAAAASSTVTLAIGTNPGGGALSGAAQAATAGGLAVFPDLSIDRMGAGYRLVASAPGLPLATSAPFSVTVHLAFVEQPTETSAGAVVSPGVKLRATEAGIPLAGVTVSLGIEGSGSGALTGGDPASTGADGNVQFDALEVDDRGAGYRIVATGVPPAGATGVGRSAPFDVLEVDQQQLVMDQTVGGLFVGGASEQKIAQVVTTAEAGDLVGVRVPVQCSSGTLTVWIRGVTGFEPNDVILASQSFYAADVRTSYLEVEGYPMLRFDAAPSFERGQTLAIVLGASGDCGVWQGPAGDSYLGGDGYFDARPNRAGVWVLFSGPAYDLPFQTIMR
jgi:hypothetical protein